MKFLNFYKNNIALTFILPAFLLFSGCSNIVTNNKILHEAKAQALVNKFSSPYNGTIKVTGVIQDEGASVAEAKIELNNFTDSQYGSYSGPGVAAFVKYNDDTWSLARVTVTPPDNFLGTRWYDTNIKE
ncbi:hypothetical protein NIES4071_107640 (plasmid) [Calothrix sp. NIES-4071]|nr:hypothetical protein NIES4071_107640 [Calothrix sp. NIES-4071]BAZ64804.1 hypothetical protein NIES4105_105370 [Calothrix sp. NIES-4105]